MIPANIWPPLTLTLKRKGKDISPQRRQNADAEGNLSDSGLSARPLMAPELAAPGTEGLSLGEKLLGLPETFYYFDNQCFKKWHK
jgi:hypothetical protein